MNQTIKVVGHSIIDYGFCAFATGGPLALGLRGRSRSLPIAFAATQGVLNALTDQPYAVKRVIPFKLHGRAESVAVPALGVLAYRSGALARSRDRTFFQTLLAALATVYALTDWNAV